MNIEEWLHRQRLYVVLVMIIASLANAFRFWGEWNAFYGVLIVQALFGRGFYSYIARKEIIIAPGGGIKEGADPLLRASAGWGVLAVYVLMFCFSGY